MPEATRGVSRRERLGLAIHRTLDRRLTPLGVLVFRRTRGAIARPWHVDALLLTTRGRRSGRERTVVLQYFHDDPSVIVAATNDGGETHPAWFLNLRAEPAASIEIEGRRFAVQAHELPPNEAAGWWERIVRRSPEYERYARATTRAFPIVRLTPAGTAMAGPAGSGPGRSGSGRGAGVP